MPGFIGSFGDWCSSHKKPLIFGGGVLLLVIFSLLQSVKQPGPTPTSSPSQPSSNDQRLKTNDQLSTPLPPPQVSFSAYENKSTFPSLSSALKTYSLKTNYTVDEAKSFGNKFGMTEANTSDPKFVVMSNLTDINNRGMLAFDRGTGGFSFQSWGVHSLSPDQKARPLGPSRSDLVQNVQSYLADLGIIDPTVSCPTTYQKQELTGVTYVECHRDWSKVGGTILNFIGLLNVPEDQSLSSLALGKPSTYTPDDSTIINTSDNSNGKARLTDFNTLTVGLAEDGRILTIDSNIRPIGEERTLSSSDFFTPQEALDQFTTHKSQLSLTIPAGSGSVNWNTVYPGNQAAGKKATITDYLLTYLEKPGQVPQETLVPMYVIRGTAELSSGYTVRFTETVPATKVSLSFLDPIEGSVAGVSTSLVAQSIKLGTFDISATGQPPSPSPSPTVTPTPTVIITPTITPTGVVIPSPTPTPGGVVPPGPINICGLLSNRPLMNKLVLQVPGLGNMTVFYGATPGGAHSYYFQSATFSVSNIEDIRNIFFKLVEDQYVINISRAIKENPSYEQYIKTGKTDDLFSSINSAYYSANPRAVETSCSFLFGEEGANTNPAELPQTCARTCTGSDIAPPISNCQQSPLKGNFDTQRSSAISQNVAKRILDSSFLSQIPTAASQTDIFPLSTTDHLSWLFYIDKSNDTGTASWFCYISGASPSLYLYPEYPMEVTVHLGLSTSYMYPSASENTWSITASPDGTVSQIRNFTLSGVEGLQLGNSQLSRLYYEYDKNRVTFTEPKNGFVIKKDEWEGFIRNTLTLKLGLTGRETDDLVTDVRNALVDVKDTNYSYLKISLADEKEIDEKLPITISPKPDTFYRIHLIVTPLDSTVTIPQPPIAPIQRNGFTAVEVGVYLSQKE